MGKVVEIFGKTPCPACDQAKLLAKFRGFEVSYLDIMKDAAAMTDLVQRLGEDIRAVPHVFVDGEYVGNATDFAKWCDKNR